MPRCSQLDTLRPGNERDGRVETVRVKHHRNEDACVCQGEGARGDSELIVPVVHELWQGGERRGGDGDRKGGWSTGLVAIKEMTNELRKGTDGRMVQEIERTIPYNQTSFLLSP